VLRDRVARRLSGLRIAWPDADAYDELTVDHPDAHVLDRGMAPASERLGNGIP
jgi:hypothetical protein